MPKVKMQRVVPTLDPKSPPRARSEALPPVEPAIPTATPRPPVVDVAAAGLVLTDPRLNAPAIPPNAPLWICEDLRSILTGSEAASVSGQRRQITFTLSADWQAIKSHEDAADQMANAEFAAAVRAAPLTTDEYSEYQGAVARLAAERKAHADYLKEAAEAAAKFAGATPEARRILSAKRSESEKLAENSASVAAQLEREVNDAAFGFWKKAQELEAGFKNTRRGDQNARRDAIRAKALGALVNVLEEIIADEKYHQTMTALTAPAGTPEADALVRAKSGGRLPNDPATIQPVVPEVKTYAHLPIGAVQVSPPVPKAAVPVLHSAPPPVEKMKKVTEFGPYTK